MFTLDDYEEFWKLHFNQGIFPGVVYTLTAKDGHKYSIKFNMGAMPSPPNASLHIIQRDQENSEIQIRDINGLVCNSFSLTKEPSELEKRKTNEQDRKEQRERAEKEQPEPEKKKANEQDKKEQREREVEAKGKQEIMFSLKKSIRPGSIQDIRQRYGSYPLGGEKNQKQIRFKSGKFILSSVQGNPLISEADHPGNIEGLKTSCLTSIQNGILFDSNGGRLSTGSGSDIYVVSRKGNLYISPPSSLYGAIHHSYFLKEGGYGKPVALGGSMRIENGKIIEIDNGTGHYQANKDQLILGIKHLHNLGVLDENVRIYCVNFNSERQQIMLKEILENNSEEILEKYEELSDPDYSSPSQERPSAPS